MQHQSKQVDLNALMLLLVSKFAKGFLVKKSFWVSAMLILLAAGGTASSCDYESAILNYESKRTGNPKQCFAFETLGDKASVITLRVREVHNQKCGGDPTTAPVTNWFKIDVGSCNLKVLDMANDEYVNLELK